MITVYFAATNHDWDEFAEDLQNEFAAAGLEANLTRDADPALVDYIVYAPTGWLKDFSPFTRLKGVHSLWAGVEKIVGNETLQVPLARMVDYGLREGMIEYCVGYVLRYHLGMDRDVLRKDAHWDIHIPPLARDRSVTILGLGALGAAVAEALKALNFQVTGWSRRQKDIVGVQCLAGDEGLDSALEAGEIVVLLLPQTPETNNILNAESLAKLPSGACILNPGRGPLIDDDALLAALDSGHIAHATLDVFRVEPLPADHPYWAHPSVTVTPHIASDTRPSSAAKLVADNFRRAEAGKPMLHTVDRSAGY
ncbi:2-hydroxyacid dehydrogenase [Boseongicola aestuarii]|uniref:Glyoxylate/hydroxypyruvate reductase A n=1 Tax=Boseongicola aestuarii TaxID=1470561 RepID=A0A238IZ85_9RHOB|nr:glyoxylate/hydroxypyruvate reductase A [Boseongicola aestuarii]SMX23343.1 Glyoxylate/hydroxypyruvate reductase A [Boseongicola aestuarii]